MKNTLFYSLSLCILVLLSFQEASACSCGPRPNVLESFERSKNVVVVKAVEVEKVPEGVKSYAVDGVRSTKMVVEKVYKGDLRIGDSMMFAQGGGGDCIWTFTEESVGERYLLYLDDPSDGGLWLAFACGSSIGLEAATEDLLYLDNLDAVRGKTRIYGTVSFGWNVAEEYRPSIEGLAVKIIGNKRSVTLKTDKNGVYEIYDLPPGKYEILPDIPKGWKLDGFYTNRVRDLTSPYKAGEASKLFVELKSGRHAGVGLRFEVSNMIRGRVFDPNGNVMKGVCIRLYPPEGIKKDFMYQADCTDANGIFKLDEIPPGSYILASNEENEITSSQPFHTLYYPGTFDLTKASVVTIGPGMYLDDMNINVPHIKEILTLNGILSYSDGKPVANEAVVFEADTDGDKRDADARTLTDEKGRFALKILKGAKGKLFGSMFSFSGEYIDCPILEKIIKRSGQEITEIETDKMDINTETDLFGLKFTFPFPMCEKDNDDED